MSPQVELTGSSLPAVARSGVSLDFAVAPLTVAWEITRACPLRCVHCRADAQHRRDPRELTTSEGLDLIAQAAEMGTRVFVITGGDPLARHDVFDLLTAARDSGMHVGISPSVTPRLTADALAHAVAAGAGTVHLSLDGANADTHDGFRGVPGSFVRTLTSIDAAHAAGARLQIGTSVSRRTVRDLPGIVPLLNGRVDLWTLFFLVPTGRAQAEDLLDAASHERVLRWLVDADLPCPARTIAAPTYRRVLAQHGRPVGPPVNDGNGFAFVSHIGDVCPSGFLQVAAGNVRDAPLSHWYRDSSLFRGLRDPERLGGKCGICEFRRVCGGSRARAWALTGDALAADPTCAYEPAAA
jgi:radical SAM protein with 4Fe4S-binding SPASM domain